MRALRISLAGLVLLSSATLLSAVERVPGDTWLRFANVQEAGFDADKLEEAHKTWSAMPSSAFMVIADGAVSVVQAVEINDSGYRGESPRPHSVTRVREWVPPR